MAKYIQGALAAMISGSIGAQTFTHSRYGSIIRTRVKPIIATSEFAANAKARFTTATQAWQSLTAAQKLSWEAWAKNNPIADKLGIKQTLTGHAAYVRINGRMLIYPGTPLSAPPVSAPPAPLTSYSCTYDIGAGTTEIAYTPTPIGANNCLWFEAAVVNSAGVKYAQNLKKYCGLSSPNAASPYDWLTETEARFGTVAVGMKVFLWMYVYDKTTGLLSTPVMDSGTVVTT